MPAEVGAEGKGGSSGGGWGPSPLGMGQSWGSAPEGFRTREYWTSFPVLPHPRSGPFCSLEKTLGESRAPGVSGNPWGYGRSHICHNSPTPTLTSHPNPNLPPQP